jgi:hypothetical protein
MMAPRDGGLGVRALALLAVLAGCAGPLPITPPATISPLPRAGEGPGVRAPAVNPPRSEVTSAAPRSPLSGAPFVNLPVEGHRAAVVSVPLGASSPRPLLVVTHGAGGSPEPHCAFWREMLGDRGFILCPRGVPLGSAVEPPDQGFFYRDHRALER